MAKGHWQIYNWDVKKKDDQDGKVEYLHLKEVLKIILNMAVKSAKLISKGLFGIDIKVVNEQPMVIEINDTFFVALKACI